MAVGRHAPGADVSLCQIEAARVAAEAEARRLNAEVELKDDDFAKLKMAKPGPAHPNVAHLPPPRVPGFFELARQQQQPVAGGPKVGAARAEKRARLNPAHPPAVKLPKAAEAPKPAAIQSEARQAKLEARDQILPPYPAARPAAPAVPPSPFKANARRVLDGPRPRNEDGKAGEDAMPERANARLPLAQAAVALTVKEKLDRDKAEQRRAVYERYQAALARIKDSQDAFERAQAKQKQAEEERQRTAAARAKQREAELNRMRAEYQQKRLAEVERYQASLARAEAQRAELERVRAELTQKQRAYEAAMAQLGESAARNPAKSRAINDGGRIAEKARRRLERQRRADSARQAQMARQEAEKYAIPPPPRLPAYLEGAVAAADTPVRAGPSRLKGSPSPRPPVDLVEAARRRDMRERAEPDVSRQHMAERNAIREAKRARLSAGRT